MLWENPDFYSTPAAHVYFRRGEVEKITLFNTHIYNLRLEHDYNIIRNIKELYLFPIEIKNAPLRSNRKNKNHISFISHNKQ